MANSPQDRTAWESLWVVHQHKDDGKVTILDKWKGKTRQADKLTRVSARKVLNPSSLSTSGIHGSEGLMKKVPWV